MYIHVHVHVCICTLYFVSLIDRTSTCRRHNYVDCHTVHIHCTCTCIILDTQQFSENCSLLTDRLNILGLLNLVGEEARLEEKVGVRLSV